MSALDNGRISLAAGSVGIAQGCVEASTRTRKERRQFGKPIAGFQLVQELIADMAVETEAARLIAWRAAASRTRAAVHARRRRRPSTTRARSPCAPRTPPCRCTAATATSTSSRCRSTCATRASRRCTRARARSRSCSSAAHYGRERVPLALPIPPLMQRLRLPGSLRRRLLDFRLVLLEPARGIVVGFEPDVLLALAHPLDAALTRRLASP